MPVESFSSVLRYRNTPEAWSEAQPSSGEAQHTGRESILFPVGSTWRKETGRGGFGRQGVGKPTLTNFLVKVNGKKNLDGDNDSDNVEITVEITRWR